MENWWEWWWEGSCFDWWVKGDDSKKWRLQLRAYGARAEREQATPNRMETAGQS
jgi:hypothetical protein